jgi:branched-chain amino acid transport system ATP-binding protein
VKLELRGVSKRFGGLRALSDVSFVVREKKIFGLIGPNGAGKTTVFNLVTGVYTPDVGSIRFGDHDLSRMAPAQIARIGIARTFQNIRLFGQLSVGENLLVAGEAHHADDAPARAHALLERFDLAKYARDPATSLPYGTQRRLEIARALMIDPKLVLLDEPAAGMNPTEAAALATRIRSLRDDLGLTVVLVEHNMKLVMDVCDELHVLDHGETIARGAPTAIREHPRVVAAYLGEEP